MTVNEAMRVLAERLESIRLADGRGRMPRQAADLTTELALARIAALTDLVRGSGDWDEASRATARLLLADLAAVSADFRARANELDALLDDALGPAGDRPGAAPPEPR